MRFTLTTYAKRYRPWILAGAIGLLSVPSFAANLTEHQNYQIPHGSLAKALNHFAAQSGIYLSSNSAALLGKTTDGFHGDATGFEVLQRLLSGSGLTYRKTETGNLVITPIKNGNNLSLQPLLINAQKHREPTGQQTLSHDDIEAMAGNADAITDLLRTNTSVDYSRNSNLSSNSASLRPDEISIHGQASYQNAYIIDGVGANNNLNPGDNDDTHANPITPTNLSMLGGSSSQSYYIDPDALSEITVYDSNIPAKFGGFTGGVVDAKVLRYQGEDTTSIKYGLESSALNSIHMDESDKQDFDEHDSYEGNYTPDFTKQSFSITSVQKINDKLDGGISFSRKQSKFDQTYTDNGGQGRVHNMDYSDQRHDLTGRMDYEVDQNTDLGITLKYSERSYDGLTSDTYDDRFVRGKKSYGISSDLTHYLDQGTLKTTLGFDRSNENVDTDSSTTEYHPTRNRYDDSPFSGGYGDVQQQQDTISATSEWTHNPFNIGHSTHNVSSGLQFTHYDSFYETQDNITNYNYRCLSGTSKDGCEDSNNDGFINDQDEYLWRKWQVSANTLNKDYQTFGLFLSDSIGYRNWTFNLGLRVDQESLLDNTNVAPRLSVDWDAFGDGSTQINFGANRYYGNSFFRYVVNDSLRSWRTQYQYDESGHETRVTTYDDRSLDDFNLKSPYSDELAFSIEQHLGPMLGSVKLINRDTHDSVMRDRDENGQYLYTNQGQSSHKSISFELSTREGHEFQLGNTYTSLNTSISWQESKSNAQSDAAYDETFDAEMIFYENKLLDSADLPSWNYNIPFKFKFSTATYITDWHLLWSNYLNLHGGGKVAKDSGENIDINGITYDRYENVEFDRYATLDTQIVWYPPFANEVNGYLKVNVDNVFDSVINVATNSSSKNYTVGREVALTLGMTF